MHVFTDGMTVKQLKDLIKDWPEVYENTGEPCEVWIEDPTTGNSSQVIKIVFSLNPKEFGSNILLASKLGEIS